MAPVRDPGNVSAVGSGCGYPLPPRCAPRAEKGQSTLASIGGGREDEGTSRPGLLDTRVDCSTSAAYPPHHDGIDVPPALESELAHHALVLEAKPFVEPDCARVVGKHDQTDSVHVQPVVR